MKLAEALMLRADLAKRLEQLKVRLQRNAKVQEGEQPAEKPDEMLSEFERVAAEFTTLIARINLTNAAASLEDPDRGLGTTRCAAAAPSDVPGTGQAGTITHSISTRSEVRFRPTVSVANIQRTADDLAKQLRELDTRIQEVNWHIELQE